MGYPNLRVELKRALKTGVRDLYTCTRAPPVYSFERGMVVEGLTILLKLLWAQSLHFNHAHLKTQTWHKFLMFCSFVSLTSLMQIWQLFIVLRQPVALSVTVFSNPTKLTNYVLSLLSKNIPVLSGNTFHFQIKGKFEATASADYA